MSFSLLSTGDVTVAEELRGDRVAVGLVTDQDAAKLVPCSW
jgi:hypothetical protein